MQFRVGEPFSYNAVVQPIPLAIPGHDYLANWATISGWGSITREPGEHVRPSILQRLDVPMLSSEECNELLDMYAPGFTHGVDNICAGSNEQGQSTCGGDSGGPLIQIDNSGILVQIGVLSWGFSPCGFPWRPAMYAGVQYHYEFIRESIANPVLSKNLV